ncbi:MAG TPA: hypothetical protein VGE06_06170, partial [Flavisolibacter sp.]
FCEIILHNYKLTERMSIKSNAWQSKREQEVIELITQGLHYKGVAVRLPIHPGRRTTALRKY